MTTLLGYARAHATIHHVCEAFGVTRDELLSRDRHERIGFARQVAIAIAARTTDMNNVEIGRLFDCDRRTVGWAIDVVRDRTDTNRLAKVRVRTIQRKVEHERFG